MFKLEVTFTNNEWGTMIDAEEKREVLSSIAVNRPFVLIRDKQEFWFFPQTIQQLVISG
jgi:hypothetical protein